MEEKYVEEFTELKEGLKREFPSLKMRPSPETQLALSLLLCFFLEPTVDGMEDSL